VRDSTGTSLGASALPSWPLLDIRPGLAPYYVSDRFTGHPKTPTDSRVAHAQFFTHGPDHQDDFPGQWPIIFIYDCHLPIISRRNALFGWPLTSSCLMKVGTQALRVLWEVLSK